MTFQNGHKDLLEDNRFRSTDGDTDDIIDDEDADELSDFDLEDLSREERHQKEAKSQPKRRTVLV